MCCVAGLPAYVLVLVVCMSPCLSPIHQAFKIIVWLLLSVTLSANKNTEVFAYLLLFRPTVKFLFSITLMKGVFNLTSHSTPVLYGGLFANY